MCAVVRVTYDVSNNSLSQLHMTCDGGGGGGSGGGVWTGSSHQV